MTRSDRAGRHWKPMELYILAENWGLRSPHYIATMLGRTERAVRCMALKQRLGPRIEAIDGVTLRQLNRLLTNEKSSNCIEHFRAKGLRIQTMRLGKRRIHYASIGDFWKWARKNVGLLNLEKLKNGELGEPPAWVEEAWRSGAQKPRYKRWTEEEKKALAREAGMSIYTEQQLADMHGRTVKGINRMLLLIGCPYRAIAQDHKRRSYTEEDKKEIMRLYDAGWHVDAIARKVGHSTGSVEGKIREMRREAGA